ncbi:MAG: response regulator transcription factor, partial [Verrucomicrobia bacterium]|nr:response regulator transcription factor [Verrucomicrobiota bacterium]
MSTRVYLLEARSLLSAGLRATLKELPEITLAGRTDAPERAVPEMARLRVDVVVADEALGWKTLGALLPEMIRLPGRPRVLVVASMGASDGPRHAAEAGAAGYLAATSSAE